MLCPRYLGGDEQVFTPQAPGGLARFAVLLRVKNSQLLLDDVEQAVHSDRNHKRLLTVRNQRKGWAIDGSGTIGIDRISPVAV
jgi:hypothetical protein